MFCSGCGAQLQSGLVYCSRCGRRVAEEVRSAGRSSTTVAGNTAGVGFVAYIFVILILSKSGVPPDLYLKVTLFYFAALFGLCFLFLRQGFGPWTFGRGGRAGERGEPYTPALFVPPQTTAQLEEPRDAGIGSVTDATTRTLDEVLIERK